jgi:hypothetical protein
MHCNEVSMSWPWHPNKKDGKRLGLACSSVLIYGVDLYANMGETWGQQHPQHEADWFWPLHCCNSHHPSIRRLKGLMESNLITSHYLGMMLDNLNRRAACARCSGLRLFGAPLQTRKTFFEAASEGSHGARWRPQQRHWSNTAQWAISNKSHLVLSCSYFSMQLLKATFFRQIALFTVNKQKPEFHH